MAVTKTHYVSANQVAWQLNGLKTGTSIFNIKIFLFRVHSSFRFLTYGHVAWWAGGLNVPQGLHERGIDLGAAVGDGEVLQHRRTITPYFIITLLLIIVTRSLFHPERIYSSFDIETVEYLRGFWQWRWGFSIRWDEAMACGQFFFNYTDPKRKSCPEMQLCITPLCMTCPHLPSFPFLSSPSENPPVLSLPAELIRVSFKALREGNSIKIISHIDAKRSWVFFKRVRDEEFTSNKIFFSDKSQSVTIFFLELPLRWISSLIANFKKCLFVHHWESGSHERSCWLHSYQVSFCGHADENQVISDAHLLSFRPLLGCWVDRPPAGLSCTDRAEKQF